MTIFYTRHQLFFFLHYYYFPSACSHLSIYLHIYIHIISIRFCPFVSAARAINKSTVEFRRRRSGWKRCAALATTMNIHKKNPRHCPMASSNICLFSSPTRTHPSPRQNVHPPIHSRRKANMILSFMYKYPSYSSYALTLLLHRV